MGFCEVTDAWDWEPWSQAAVCNILFEQLYSKNDTLLKITKYTIVLLYNECTEDNL